MENPVAKSGSGVNADAAAVNTDKIAAAPSFTFVIDSDTNLNLFFCKHSLALLNDVDGVVSL